VQVTVEVLALIGGGEWTEIGHGRYTVSYVTPQPRGQAVGQTVVLKMLGQPHSNVMVFNSKQSGRAQDPEMVGQVGPSVSVIVTQSVGVVAVGAVLVDPLRTRVAQVTKTTATEPSVSNRILEYQRMLCSECV